MAVLNRFAEMLPEISMWRRDIHAYPELRFQEHRTAAFVASKLKEFGCDAVSYTHLTLPTNREV